MKLELLSIHAANNPCCMLVQMRGQSGEVYHFHGGVSGEQRVEDMLTHIAGEIAATRRKRAKKPLRVKSLMPTTWGKSKAKILTAEPDGSVTVRQAFSRPIMSSEWYKLPKEMRVETPPVGEPFTYDPTKAYGRCSLVGADVWSKATVRMVQNRALERLRGEFPVEARKRLKWIVEPTTSDQARGVVAWRIDPAPVKKPAKRRGKR